MEIQPIQTKGVRIVGGEHDQRTCPFYKKEIMFI